VSKFPMRLALGLLTLCVLILTGAQASRLQTDTATGTVALQSQTTSFEYLWYEAENMRGISATSTNEPVSNPSWMHLPASKAPGWGINGPGVSAEWTQGGESEWNSVNASSDETRGTISQDIEVPRAGDYKVWVRYADWAAKTENFTLKISQNSREVFAHEFGAKDIIDPHDEIEMYWQWAFAWDGAPAPLLKGPARVSIEISKAAQASRQVDCFVITNDLSYAPRGRQKPEFAAARYLREFARTRPRLAPLIDQSPAGKLPASWALAKVAGREFVMPWNIAKDFWSLYDKPQDQRPLYPFNAEPIDEFVKAYSGKREVPIFDSKFVVPVVYLNDLPELLKDTSPFRRYLRETRSPFAVLINYGAANFASEADAQAASALLRGELRDQFLGWISGESVGYVWNDSPKFLRLTPEMTRTQMLEALRVFYSDALARKWGATFKGQADSMWDKLIPAQSTSSTAMSHSLAKWGVRLLGMESAAVQPMTAMRIAFTRGAARQFGGGFLYYHAPNFGDTATTFTKTQNFAGPDNFFHSRYGATMGPSLSWYRKSYYLYYMSGASAIYLEQGFDQFFKPGPGEHPFQLNPLGRITDEFVRFAETHPDRGTPYTPIAFLLDPAHGWDMTDYPQWAFGASPIGHNDRARRELFGAAYYPGLVREGEPASGERQAFVPGLFGNIFDVLVATRDTGGTPVRHHAQDARVTSIDAIDSYRAVIAGGEIEWTPGWAKKLEDYVRNGGVVVLNAAQTKGLPMSLLGLRLRGETAEADNARCLLPGESAVDLSGQVFHFERVDLTASQPLMVTTSDRSEPLVTVNKIGRGKLILVTVRDFLGEDERLLPAFAHLLAHLASEATPVEVKGDVEYLINRNSNGWVVTLFNDSGVFKPQQGMAQVDRNASASVTIALRNQKLLSATNWITNSNLQVDGDSNVHLTIAAGGVAIVELR
jgi:hypothetical protein